MENILNDDMIKIIKNRAAQFTGHGVGVEFDDLVQEGVIICLKAFEEYRPDKGTKFTTYLYRCLTNRFCNIRRYHRQWISESLNDIKETIENSTHQPGDYLMDLSEDARECAKLAFESFNMKTEIKEHLYKNGWSISRINTAFKELQEYLK